MIRQDVRYALRMMRRSPGFTAVAVFSLALGIGANTAIFSLIDSIMLRMLPVPHPQELVEFLSHYPGEPRGNGFSFASYEHYRDHNHVLTGLTGATVSLFRVRAEGRETETLDGQYVLGNFFPVLGVKPALGRLIGPDDSGVAVVSWSYWKSRFSLDPSILGRRIIVDDAPLTIIGVTPPEFFGLLTGYKPEIWAAAAQPESLALIGRLKPGISIDQARAEMAVLFQFTIEERARGSKDPQMRQSKIEVEPAGAGLSTLRDRFGKPLLLLMPVVGLLLLIACINLASMLLAQGAARQREMALRVSLGASRFRIVRQVLTESVLLSVAGSLPGILLAYCGAGLLVRILASGRREPGLPLGIQIPVQTDVRVLLFTAGIALITGLLFGLAPAWKAFAAAPASSLQRSRRGLGKSLVVAQVALSLVLLSAAGTLVRYLWNLRNLDLGFERGHVLLVSLDAARSGYSPERLSGAYRELLGRLETIPGVRSATLSGATPISGAGASSFVNAEGFTEERPQDRRYVAINSVAPKYFSTLGTPFLAGRDFGDRDALGGPRVAIVNQAMARYYFGDRNPVGKHVTLEHMTGGDNAAPIEIVGVVGDAKYLDLHEAAPRTIYLDAFQTARVPSQFLLRTRGTPAAVTDEVRRAVGEVVSNVSLTRVTTMADQVDASIVPERLIAGFSELFAGLGALLAAIGIYGLLAYTVARRTHEIGIRMALGATHAGVARMVLADALGIVCAGVVIGAPVSVWSKSVVSSLIADLPSASVAPVVLGAIIMVVVALLAAYLPARCAAGVEPMEALRHE